MSVELQSPKKVKIIKADTRLQAKVGIGSVDVKMVEKCQKVIDGNVVDFAPLANEFLDKLKTAIADTKSGKLPKDKAVEAMSTPVMQLKANAATFRYELISNLANVMLSFLESITALDDDVLAIVEAHYKTLSAIVLKKMSGTGGSSGKLLEDELKGACKRYFSRSQKS